MWREWSILKNIISAFLIFITILLSLTACSYASKPNNATETTKLVDTVSGTQVSSTDIEASIYVNDELLESKTNALISNDFVKIPFVSVFEALGASVSWQSNTNATLSYNGKTYFLNTDALTISNSNIPPSDPNLTIKNSMFGVYGGTAILYAQDKEVITDSHNLTILFKRLGINVTIKYDRENKVVYINKT